MEQLGITGIILKFLARFCQSKVLNVSIVTTDGAYAIATPNLEKMNEKRLANLLFLIHLRIYLTLSALLLILCRGILGNAEEFIHSHL